MFIGIDANEANITRRVGINVYAFELLHALKKANTGHKFVIYLKKLALPDLPQPSPDWSYRVLPFPKFWTQTRLPWDLYFHRPRPEVFLSLTHYAPRFSPIPTVISIMDLGFKQYPDQFTQKDLHQLNSWTDYSVAQAKKIIAISEYTKSDIQRYYHRLASDIEVTYLGFDKNVFYPHSDPQVLKKYRITQPYILFVSSLKPSKNITGLVKAFSQLNQNHLQLVIVGKKAWDYEEIFNLVKSLYLQERVIFTDYVPDAEVPILMSMAQAFVLPSFHEGFALPAIEAMACGTPVVVSQNANLPEVGGQAVVYVDPTSVTSIRDGILTAIGPDRNQLIKMGFAQSRPFTWAKTAAQTISVLKSAI